jgi:hypothetical protein
MTVLPAPIVRPTAWTVSPPTPRLDIGGLPGRAAAELDAALGGTPNGCAGLVGHLRDVLASGPGFLVVSGLPGGADSRDRCASLLTWLLAGFGDVLTQNVAGDLVYDVIDRSDPRGFYGGSRSTDALLDHTDQAAAPAELLPDILALWCVEPAASGGASVLASGHALHNLLHDIAPEALARCYRPMPFARPADGTSDAAPVWSPVFTPAAGAPRVRYNRYFVELGARATGIVIDDELTETLAAAEAALAGGPRVEVPLAAGELLLVDNTAVLHNRTAYTDSPPRRRLLLRGWARTARTITQLEGAHDR